MAWVTSWEEESSLLCEVPDCCFLYNVSASWVSLLPEDFTSGDLVPSHPDGETTSLLLMKSCYSPSCSSGFSNYPGAFLGIMENSYRGFVVSRSWAVWLPLLLLCCWCRLLGWRFSFFPAILLFSPPRDKSCLKKRVLLEKCSNPLFINELTQVRVGCSVSHCGLVAELELELGELWTTPPAHPPPLPPRPVPGLLFFQPCHIAC